MINQDKVEEIHNILIEEFGGSKGVGDVGLFLSALARPYATFDLQYLYPTAVKKAAAIFESIIINHPFLDGNKRTAFFLMRMTLLDYNFDVSATQDEKYDMTIAASQGYLKIEETKSWINEKLITTHK